MEDYHPLDSRARVTFNNLISNYLQAVSSASSIKDVVHAITQHLPPGVAHRTELRLKMTRGKKSLDDIKEQAITVAQDTILSRLGDKLLGRYYMREDVIRWYSENPVNLTPPTQESITITVKYNDLSKSSTMALNEDQMIGIAYGLNSFNKNPESSFTVALRSSITNSEVEVDQIAAHAEVYRMPITLATEELKRPYRVDIKDSENTYVTVRFINPEFMQGVLSAAMWHQLPQQGKGTLWKNLYQFTREALVPLEF